MSFPFLTLDLLFLLLLFSSIFSLSTLWCFLTHPHTPDMSVFKRGDFGGIKHADNIIGVLFPPESWKALSSCFVMYFSLPAWSAWPTEPFWKKESTLLCSCWSVSESELNLECCEGSCSHQWYFLQMDKTAWTKGNRERFGKLAIPFGSPRALS